MNSIYCKIRIYIHKKLFVPQAPDLLEKLAEISPQLSSRTHFAKIEDKKVIAKK